jgi:O-acetyl-ADP-ribose deacetylase (regulator of RNase III)
VRPIAFPGISTGVHGYPLEAATRTAIATVRDCLEDMPTIEQVRFVTFGDQATATAERLLAEIGRA